MIVQVTRGGHSGFSCVINTNTHSASNLQAMVWSQSLTCAAFDIDIDVNSTICLFSGSLTRSSCNSDAIHFAWLVHTSTRALEDPLLHPGFDTVKVALILDLDTSAALSLQEVLDLLCCNLNISPRFANVFLSAMRPQEGFQLSSQSFSRSDLTAEARTQRSKVSSLMMPLALAVACPHLLLHVFGFMLSLCTADRRHGAVSSARRSRIIGLLQPAVCWSSQSASPLLHTEEIFTRLPGRQSLRSPAH